MKKTKIGFVGVGCISGIYLENITNMFDNLEVIGVCDLIPERAKMLLKNITFQKSTAICMNCLPMTRLILFLISPVLMNTTK